MPEERVVLGPRVHLVRTTDDHGRVTRLRCVVDGAPTGPFLVADPAAGTGHCDARPPGPVRQEYAEGELRIPNMFGDDDHPRAVDYETWIESCEDEVEAFAFAAALDAAAEDALAGRDTDAAATYEALVTFAPESEARVQERESHYLGPPAPADARVWRESAGLPDYAGKWHRLSVSPQGVLLCAGGMEGETYTGQGRPSTQVAVWDPTAERWEPRPPLPVATAYQSMVWLDDDRLMVFGGATEDHGDARVACFSLAKSRWQALAPLPGARGMPSAVRLRDGRIFVAGGAKAIAVYDPEADEWTEGPSLPFKHSAPVVIQIDDGRVAVLDKVHQHLVDLESGELSTPALAESFHRLVTTDHFALWPMRVVSARHLASGDIALLCVVQDPAGEARRDERLVTARWRPAEEHLEWQPGVIPLEATNLPSAALLDGDGTALAVLVREGGECVTRVLPFGAHDPLSIPGPIGHYRAQTLQLTSLAPGRFLGVDGKSTLRLSLSASSRDS